MIVINIPNFEESKTIPKIIHQTYLSKDLPVELQENVDNLKRLNPDWIYQLYDDNDIQHFVAEYYGPVILRYFNCINPKYGAARADLFRYLLIYKFGGVYLDIKSTCGTPLNEAVLPDDKYILSQWRNSPGEIHATYGIYPEISHIYRGEYQQWFIIAVAGHPFLKAVIEKILFNIIEYRPWSFGTGAIGVLRLTGPIPYTLAIHSIIQTAAHRLVNNETDINLQYSVYITKHHRSAYKKHYSSLTESLVKMSMFNNFLGLLYSLLKRVKHYFKLY